MSFSISNILVSVTSQEQLTKLVTYLDYCGIPRKFHPSLATYPHVQGISIRKPTYGDYGARLVLCPETTAPYHRLTLLPFEEFEQLTSEDVNEQALYELLTHYDLLDSYLSNLDIGKDTYPLSDVIRDAFFWRETSEGTLAWTSAAKDWDKLVTTFNLTGRINLYNFYEKHTGQSYVAPLH